MQAEREQQANLRRLAKALGCSDCHSSNGRLEKVDGIYIPGRGRDHIALLDTAGWALVGLTVLGVAGHGDYRRDGHDGLRHRIDAIQRVGIDSAVAPAPPVRNDR